MGQSIARPSRKARPALEGLEGRELPSTAAAGPGGVHADAASPPPARAIAREIGIPPGDRRISYTTPQGTHVTLTVYGLGSLAGTTVDPDGALNLVFSQTNAATGIIAHVSGGTRRALLRSVQPANLAFGDLSGIGGTALNILNLKDFDLVNNGQINLTSGVHSLFLDSVGVNTQIHLREVPPNILAASQPMPSSSTTTSSIPTTSTSNGVTLQYTQSASGVLTLASVSGQFTAGPNLVEPKRMVGQAVVPGPPPAPPGIVAQVRHVHGAPTAQDPLGDPEVFGYDPVANTLIRFDTATGAALQTIPLPNLGTPIAGAALGRDHGRLVALVGIGAEVLAFDALTGAQVGQFTITNLASLGLHTIDGIGSTDTQTVISDASAGPDGTAVLLDVTASLARGQAVTVGNPFSPQRQFELSGGLTGVPASRVIDSTGAAHFDTFQPDLTQFGILQIDTSGGQLSEAGRSALLNDGMYINIGPTGTARGAPFNALGSLDQSLALVTGVSDGSNVVTLYGPQTLTSRGTITLDDPNRLAGLSESFYPNLVGSALIDIQGNVQSFRANDAQGMVLNDAGNLNLVKIAAAAHSVIVGEPFGHAQIPHRSNVVILSTSRTVDGRNGVTVIPTLRQLGPLSLPS